MPDKNPTNRKSDQQKVSHTVHHESRVDLEFTSPFPPSFEFEKLGEVVPNGADRAFRMVEKQSDHRQEIEKQAVANETFKTRVGLVSGLVFVLALLGCSTYLLSEGKNLEGGLLSSGGFIAITLAFLGVNKTKSTERIEKTRIMASVTQSGARRSSNKNKRRS